MAIKLHASTVQQYGLRTCCLFSFLVMSILFDACISERLLRTIRPRIAYPLGLGTKATIYLTNVTAVLNVSKVQFWIIYIIWRKKDTCITGLYVLEFLRCYGIWVWGAEHCAEIWWNFHVSGSVTHVHIVVGYKPSTCLNACLPKAPTPRGLGAHDMGTHIFVGSGLDM